MSKKTWILISCLVLSLVLGLSGSLAYLTDMDSEVNTFTMGGVSIDLTEDFQQDATLKPGVDITKKPIITNTGTNDAWVWLTWAIPEALDVWNPNGIAGADKNVIHWNFLGATCEDYLGNQAYLESAIAKGHLDSTTTLEQIKQNKTYWTYFPKAGEATSSDQQMINGVLYNVYVIKYNKALAPQEVTLPSIVNVYLDNNVDKDAEGNLYFIENGNKTDIGWNVSEGEDGMPQIIVNAYAIQAEGFDNVEQAYAAYSAQWETTVDTDGTTTETVGEGTESTGDVSVEGADEGGNEEDGDDAEPPINSEDSGSNEFAEGNGVETAPVVTE